jgi:putative hemin transport protein
MLEMIDTPVGESPADDHTRREIIKGQYEALDDATRSKRARDVARALNLSEAQWVAAQCGPIKSLRLKGTGQSVFRQIQSLGQVMALTRNESCVHERHGAYQDIQAQGPVGLVLGPDIDLRAFFSCWQDAYAVQEGTRQSLQFFDAQGQAVHKVYCTEQTDLARYHELVQSHVLPDQWPDTKAIPKHTRPDTPNDAAGLRHAWLALTDTHDFYPMLGQFDVSRLGALKHAGDDLAQQVHATKIEAMLEAASSTDLQIMCFVGNRGMIQIHTGSVKHIVTQGPWLNVLDPTFNLHLNMADVSSVCVVNKPTTDGWVTSLEAFDVHGELIVQFFGARKPGIPELPAWRELMASLCHAPFYS